MTEVLKVAAAKKTVATKPLASKTQQASVPAKTKYKAVAKPSEKPVAKSVAKPAPAQDAKQKKPKMVRDSFTFPKAEYAVLDDLKMRSAKLGKPAKKTELLRAGIKAIAAMQDAAFLGALKAVPSLKTGRPAKS